MVLCDWCNGGVHTYCHQPKLADIPDPDRDWYCFRCTSDRADEIRVFKEAREVALGLREQHRAAQRRAGISDAEMFEATAALLAGEGPTQSTESGAEEDDDEAQGDEDGEQVEQGVARKRATKSAAGATSTASAAAASASLGKVAGRAADLAGALVEDDCAQPVRAP
jgi:PHD-finger